MSNAELSLLAIKDLKYPSQHKTKTRRINVKQINKLAKRKVNLKKLTNANKRDISWFGPRDLHSVPKPPAWDFPLSLILYTQNHKHAHHLTNPLCQMCTPSLPQREHLSPCTTASTPRSHPCTMITLYNCLYTKKPPVYNDCFEYYNTFPISLGTECVCGQGLV